MVEKRKARRVPRKARGDAVKSAAKEPDEQPVASEPPKVIRKGIYLSALIYVEGEQPAPDDYAAWATSTLKKALTEALKDERDGLRLTLRGVKVQNDVEEGDDEEEGDTEEDSGKSDKEEKFQF